MKNLTNFKTRNNQLLRGLLFFLAIMGIIVINATAQVTITTNFANNNGFSQVTFNFQNTNASDVIITEIGSVTSGTGTLTATAYYKTSAINGSPGNINSANGWNSFGTGAYTAIPNTTTSTAQPMLTGLSLVIPAGATYGISFATTSLRYSTLTAGTYTFPGGGCNIISGTNIGYGGDFPPAIPGNTPRGFIGYVTFVSSTACSGTPNPGNTISSVNPICLGNNFTLSLQNPSFESGITYQWLSSTDNITYSNIAGATNSNYTTTQTASTYYQCIVTCTNSGLVDTSAALQVTLNPPSGCYCTSNATSTADEEILNVTLGTLNNTSTCSTTGGTGSILNEYSDYTALPAPMLGQSTSVNFSVEIGTCGGNYSNGIAIWIDYNQNGVFTDPGEKVYFSPTTTSGPHVETGSFTIPLTATLGNTRMRVISSESSVPTDPCGTYTWGETEDYTVNIVGPPTCIQPSALNAAPADIYANLSWTTNSSETAWDIQYGLSGFTLGTGTIIENISSNPYTLTGLTPITTYQFYVLAQCSPTDSSFWSGPFTFTTACVVFSAPFVENFNTTVIPNCWTMSGPQTWVFTTTWPNYGAQGVVEHTGNSGSFAGVDGSGTASLTGITLLSPLVDVSSLTVPMLTFYLFNNNINNADYQTLTVDFWDGSTWQNAIYTCGPTDNNATWQEIQLGLGSYTITGPVQVRFIVAKSAGSPYYDDVIIDDVTIDEAPTCPHPISLTASGISDVSANLGWTINGSETAWDIQYGITGFVLGTGTIIQNVSSNPYTLTGLTANTAYQFYVLAQCSPTDSSTWVGPYSFTTLLTACTGVPTVGIASAPASVCVAENFSLTLTGFGTDGGISFQWQSSTDNITFTNIAGATTATYVTTQTVATYYQCIVSCSFSAMSDTSNVVQVTMNAPTACYCTSNATTTADEEIFNVTLSTLNNTSNCTTTGGTGSILNEYSNYTAITPLNLIKSLTYPFSVEVNTCGTSNYNSGLAIFIDYNQNGLFTDPGEKVYSNGAAANITCIPSTIVTGSFLIPITALTGNTRMRVIDAEGNAGDIITPCLIYGYGETEDYMVNILPVPTCPQPTNLSASTFTQTSAVLSWTNGGSETSWDIQYGLTGFVLGTGTIVNNVTTNPYTLNGLIASSIYQYYVSGQCSPTDSSYWSGPFEFSTLCGPTTALYIQKFDAVTAPAIPNCWSTIVLGSGGSPFVQTSTITPNSLPNCAQLFNSSATGSTTHILLIGPQFSDMPTHTTQIRFMARYGGSGACVLNVGTMSNPTNPTTFSTFQSITTITNTWQEFVVSFGGYMGSNQTIAFKHGLAVLNQNIYIDDVYYEVIPTCPKPLQITTSNITSSSVDINWNPGGTETAWNIEYGPTGFIQGTGTTINVTINPYTLSGLTNSTDYDFYFQADCGPGDSSIWQGPYSFSTPTCNPSEMCMHYLSGLDSFGDGWNSASVTIQQNGVTVKVFTFTGGTAYNDSVSLCNGANIDLIWAGGSYPSECGFSMTDFYGYPVTSFATGNAPVAGTFFSFIGNCNPPSCPRPTGLTASNLLPTSADLSWTNGGAEAQWQIEYGTYGFTQGTGTFVIANTNPYTLSGLSQGLSYSYYIRAICGVGDTSIWQGQYSFTLPCVPYTATYTQNFDAATVPNIPLCWTSKIVVANAGAYVQTSTTAPSSVPNCAVLYNSNNTGATTHILLVSPQFTDLTSHSTQVRFWAKGGSSLIVGTMTDPSNENTFTQLSAINNLNATTWQEYVVSFVGYNGTDEHFAFKHGTTSNYTYVYVDDVVYEPAPANDISVTQVLAPNGGCGLSATENITCKIKNTGAAAQSNIPLGYNINGGAVVGPETFTGTLNPGDSAIYTFTATADFTTYGTFTIKTFSMDITDLYHPNDTAYKTFVSSALVNTFPYFDNFETANNYWTSGGTLNSWQLGTPAGATINTAASGTNAWMTNLTTYYNNNEASYVVGPCFDFTTLTNPFVRLKRWVNAENSWDGAALQSSIDGGLTWLHVGLLGDPTWYNDGTINGLAFSGSQQGWTGLGTGWVSSSHAIASLAGQANVKFRIVFGADGSINSYDGFAFDDFEIYEPSDLALVYPIAGTYQQCGMSATDTITFCVKNVGSTTIPSGDNIYAWYKVDLNTPVADTLTLTSNLMAGDSIFFNFSQTYDFSSYTTYLVGNWISYAGDYSTSNDTITTTLVNYQLTVNILGGDTILTDPNYLPYTMLLQGSPYVYETYFWSNFDGTVTGTASTFDAPALGWYYLTVTGGTCTASDSVFLGDLTTAPLNSISEGINVFPNPTHGKFIVEINSKNTSDYKLELISADGRIVNSKLFSNVNKVRETYNESKLAEGVYYLKITGNGKQQINKIVIY